MVDFVYFDLTERKITKKSLKKTSTISQKLKVAQRKLSLIPTKDMQNPPSLPSVLTHFFMDDEQCAEINEK